MECGGGGGVDGGGGGLGLGRWPRRERGRGRCARAVLFVSFASGSHFHIGVRDKVSDETVDAGPVRVSQSVPCVRLCYTSFKGKGEEGKPRPRQSPPRPKPT